jgi:hypothetical protein
VANDIDSYLRELQAALATADPALTQDALFDAEEHLQAEIAAGGEFATVVEGYGTPDEVAAAYMGVAPVREAGPVIRAEAPVEAQPAVDAAATADAGPAVGAAPEPAPTASGSFPPAAALPPTFAPAPAGIQAGVAAAGAGASPSVARQIFGVFVDPNVYKALLYMILSLGTGIAYFTIVVTGLSTAGGMLVLIVGLPLLLLVLGIVRAMALFEGRLVELFLGTRMPRRPRAEPPGAGFVQRMSFWLKDGRTWASMGYMILMLPLGIVYFTVAVTGLATGLGLIAAPLWGWVGNHTFVYHPFVYDGVTYQWWFPVWGIPLAMIAGVIVLVAWLHLVRWIGRGHAAFAKAMLVRLAK